MPFPLMVTRDGRDSAVDGWAEGICSDDRDDIDLPKILPGNIRSGDEKTGEVSLMCGQFRPVGA